MKTKHVNSFAKFNLTFKKHYISEDNRNEKEEQKSIQNYEEVRWLVVQSHMLLFLIISYRRVTQLCQEFPVSNRIPPLNVI